MKVNKKINNKVIKILSVVITIYWVVFGAFFLFNGVEKLFYPLRYKTEILSKTEYYDLDKSLVFSLVKAESNFNSKAVSKKGAKGLMQITDKTAEYVASLLEATNYDIFDVETNLNFGCFYLKYLIEKFNDEDLAVVAYNAGEGNVRLWLNTEKYSNDKKTLKDIPYSETKEYYNKIKNLRKKYKKLYFHILDK